MARSLALEWDNQEARLLVASVRAGEVTVEDAFTVTGLTAEGDDESTSSAGEKIAAALATRRIGGIDTYVAVGRANIELKRLSLPPAPDEDLPDLVQFQAEREFTSLTEQSRLDFLPLSDDPSQQRVVLAAAINGELVEQIEQTCRDAGLKPRRLVLRPCAAASLLCRRTKADSPAGVRLLVDLLTDEADLTVMEDEQVVLLRTARLSGAITDSPNESGSLVAEIRRTIAAAQNQLGGRVVDEIRLCAGVDEYGELIQHIENTLHIPTRRFNPFEQVNKKSSLAANPPEHPGRFAPLLGMLLDEADQSAHGIDFLNPRRRPQPASRRRAFGLAAACAAVVAVSVGGWLWYQAHLLSREIAHLSQQIKQQQKLVDEQDEIRKKVAQIDEWASKDVVWLDELRELSEDFPDAEQAMLTQLRINPHAEGGEMQLEGLVRETGTVDKLESGLRDASQWVEGNGRSQEQFPGHYRWQFSSVLVKNTQPDRAPAKEKN